jgi:hypothetical protein
MAEECSEVQPAVSETDKGAAGADRVNLQSSAAKSIDAETVMMHSSAAQTVDAETIEMHSSAAQRMVADTIRMVQSQTFGVHTETLVVEQSNLGLLRAANATLADSTVFALVSDRVQAAHVSAMWLIARQVEGEVKTLFDLRSAAVFGAVLGGVLSLFALVAGMLRRR